jgi:hypothetical protein
LRCRHVHVGTGLPVAIDRATKTFTSDHGVTESYRTGRGHVFCARSRDGGKNFTFEGFVGEEPEGFTIMPASIPTMDGKVLTLVRCSAPGKGPERKTRIDAYTSADEGRNWDFVGRPVPNTGYAGNPPTLNRLNDGRLVVAYGYRDAPYDIRARVTSDERVSWSEDLILRDDGGKADLGYPRTVVRPDCKVLSKHHYNYGGDQERVVAASIYEIVI